MMESAAQEQLSARPTLQGWFEGPYVQSLEDSDPAEWTNLRMIVSQLAATDHLHPTPILETNCINYVLAGTTRLVARVMARPRDAVVRPGSFQIFPPRLEGSAMWESPVRVAFAMLSPQLLQSFGDGAFPPAPVSDSVASNEARRQALLRAGEALETGDYAFFDELLADDYVVHSPFGDLNRVALQGFFDTLRAALTDFKLQSQDIIVEGQMAAVRFTITGVFENELHTPTGVLPPNGQPVTLQVSNVFHFDEQGRIREEWASTDTVSYLTQFGAFPPPGA